MQNIKMLWEVLGCARYSLISLSIKHTSPAPFFCRTLAAECRRLYSSTTVIAPATFEGEEKSYAPKIQKLVSEISQLTLLEVADLNDLLKKSLKISDMPMMMPAMGGAAAKPQEAEDAPEPKVEKSLFTIRLTKFDEAKKVALIKEVKSVVAGMNLVQAKKFVESLPQTLRSDVTKDEAEKLKVALIAVGATVEID